MEKWRRPRQRRTHQPSPRQKDNSSHSPNPPPNTELQRQLFRIYGGENTVVFNQTGRTPLNSELEQIGPIDNEL